MEKRNVIEPGRTPPAPEAGVKQAANLEEHVTSRLAETVATTLSKDAKPNESARKQCN